VLFLGRSALAAYWLVTNASSRSLRNHPQPTKGGQLATQPSIPWWEIVRLRDHLPHRYFDASHAIVPATVDQDLPDLNAPSAGCWMV
jgi:Ribonuclease HepT-like